MLLGRKNAVRNVKTTTTTTHHVEYSARTHCKTYRSTIRIWWPHYLILPISSTRTHDSFLFPRAFFYFVESSLTFPLQYLVVFVILCVLSDFLFYFL